MTVSAATEDQDNWRLSMEKPGCWGNMPFARHRWASTQRKHVLSSSLSGQWSRVALSTVTYSLSSSCPISRQANANSGKLVKSLIRTKQLITRIIHNTHCQCDIIIVYYTRGQHNDTKRNIKIRYNNYDRAYTKTQNIKAKLKHEQIKWLMPMTDVQEYGTRNWYQNNGTRYQKWYQFLVQVFWQQNYRYQRQRRPMKIIRNRRDHCCLFYSCN